MSIGDLAMLNSARIVEHTNLIGMIGEIVALSENRVYLAYAESGRGIVSTYPQYVTVIFTK